MSFITFISSRLLKQETSGSRVSKTIIRISIGSIAIALVVNLLTVAIVQGFQQQVLNKVTGFGSHLVVMSNSDANIFEAAPILLDSSLLSEIKKHPNVKTTFPVGFKPILFQSKRTTTKIQLNSGKDSTIYRQDIQAAMLKGVDSSYDFSFFKSNLTSGRLPDTKSPTPKSELIISQKLADILSYSLGDTARIFFVRSLPVLREFKIVGIYQTGLEEYDQQIVLCDLRHVQEMNDWGIQSRIAIEDTLYREHLIIRGDPVGGEGRYRYNWGKGYVPNPGVVLYPLHDTSFTLVTSTYFSDIFDSKQDASIPDTAFLKVKIKGEAYSACDFETYRSGPLKGQLIKHYLPESSTDFYLQASKKKVYFHFEQGKGSFSNYIGGYEILVKDWEQLGATQEDLKRKMAFIPGKNRDILQIKSITESEADLFVWLDFLDINVWIIIALMLIIGIINMGSALLVLIIVRTSFIGTLKALGSTNWQIRKIFLIQAGGLVLKGMLIGNLIGMSMALLQYYFQIIPLNSEVYYLSTVPIKLSIGAIILLNAGTLIICLLALIIPSWVITRINPARAIKMN